MVRVILKSGKYDFVKVDKVAALIRLGLVVSLV